jgi:hypothetical protein
VEIGVRSTVTRWLMTRLPKRTLFSIAALALLLFCLNLWLARNRSLDYSSTSFGVAADGYKAAYDLLTELHIPVTRSYSRSWRVPHNRVLWFIVPDFLSPVEESFKVDTSDLKDWIRAGGVAVIMGDPKSEWDRFDLEESVSKGGDSSTIQGDFAPVARKIPIPDLVHFDKASPNSRVRLTSDGKPFALDLKIGSGRLIAIADGKFVLNSNLDQGDDSVLVVDLARALGTPDFDEHSHGLATPESMLALLANPRLLAVLLITLITALLWIAEQHSWPPRRLEGQEAGAPPSIDSFVESLGVLYSQANDPRAAFRAYRASFLRRARRQLSPRIETSDQAVIDRFSRDRSLSNESRRWLMGNESNSPSTETELVSAVRALESCPSPTHESRRQ